MTTALAVIQPRAASFWRPLLVILLVVGSIALLVWLARRMATDNDKSPDL